MSDKTITKKNEYTNCGGCKNSRCLWRDWEWFSPQAQMYCRSLILWYLENRTKYFVEMKWPDNPMVQSTYTDPAVRSGEAKVDTHVISEFRTEIEIRLESCGDAGLALIDEVASWGDNLTVSIPYSYLSRPAKNALNYCCGKNRRRETFAHWKCRTKEPVKKG